MTAPERGNALFLFTKVFPFGSAEEYLADEIPFLVSNFSKVYIIPTEYFGPYSKERRTLPEGCELIDLNKTSATIFFSEKAKLFFLVYLSAMIRGPGTLNYLIKFRNLWGLLLHQYLQGKKLLQTFPENSAHEIYFYSYWCHNSALMLSLLKMDHKILNFVTRAHSFDLYHEAWTGTGTGFLPFKQKKFDEASAIFPVSKAGETHLKNTQKEWGSKTKCQYLGIQSLSENPWLETAKFTLVSCSSLSANKRIVKIAEILSFLNIPCRWVHFGDGPERNLIETSFSKLPENIMVELRGQTPNQEIRSFYATEPIHLFINVSEAEGIPVSMMEAISAGIPVMATSVYGNPEIANEKTGFSIPLNFRAEKVAKLITNFANDPIWQKQIRNQARAYFLNHFQAAQNYPKFIQELKKYPGNIERKDISER